MQSQFTEYRSGSVYFLIRALLRCIHHWYEVNLLHMQLYFHKDHTTSTTNIFFLHFVKHIPHFGEQSNLNETITCDVE